ncbi:hypothetical protein LX32DRAFT_615613 [Colletotrichum zoysiae]|uniref:Uncharacterized protein n=1 Tax=Colletotrichum zoysiae TaxID=1216348 RepID=A0AAD9HK78_9PEZI|nr:hypothetical protein LX32DRAFT_615613 [Colletotrichum zoysiae]
MISQRFLAVLVLLGGALVDMISAQHEGIRPFAGNDAYSVDYDNDDTTGRWIFNVYGDGYTGTDGSRKALDSIMVNTQSKRLTIIKAMNGLDKTVPLLKMRDVVQECWRMAGLQPSDMKEIMGYKVDNKTMQSALTQCRQDMNLQPRDSFVLSSTDTDPAKKTCWNRLAVTPFGNSVQSLLSQFLVNKKVTQIKVEDGGSWDNMYYELS